MCSAWVIQRVCGGISQRWKRGGWRRRDYCDRDSASPKWRAWWASTGSRSAAGRRSLNNRECAGCARPSAPAGHPSSTRPSCATSSARSSAGPRRSASPAGCGPRAGCALSSSTGPGCGTTRTTSGAFCASSTGAASVPAAKRSSATSRRSGSRRESRGRGLKKSPLRAAHDRLHRRKRSERTAAAGADLGAARADPGAATSFQLESAVGGGRHHLVELLLPALSWRHPCRRGDRLPRPSAATSAGQAAGGLGRVAAAPGAAGHGVHPRAAGPAGDRALAGLRAGTQPGRIYLGLLETFTSCPTSARAISANSAIRRAAHCGACAGAHAWCARSGSKQICHYDMQTSNRSLSNSSIVCPSIPAAPRFAFTCLYASHTSRFAIQNGLALFTRILPVRVVHWIKPDDDAPSVQSHYRTFFPNTCVSAPVLRIGTQTLAVTDHLGFSLSIGATGSCVPYRSRSQSHAAFMPDAGWAISRHFPNPCSQNPDPNPGFDVVSGLTTRHQRFTRVRLLETHLTECSSAFSNNAHHQGSLPSQLVVVWNLLLQADSGGPSPISDKAFTAHDLPPLAQILVAGLSQLAVRHDLVPVDALLTLALSVSETFVSGNREAHDRLPIGWQVAQFEVLTEISNDSGSIQ